MYIKKANKLVYTRLGDNKNEVLLSSIYPNNCSAEEYVTVTDEVLEVLIAGEKRVANMARYAREHETAMPYDDAIEVKIPVVEEQYSFDREEQEHQKKIFREELRVIFDQLTDKQRARVYLHIKYGMTFDAIAELEGIAQSTVQESCSNAYKKLKKHRAILLKRADKSWIELLKPTNLQEIFKKFLE